MHGSNDVMGIPNAINRINSRLESRIAFHIICVKISLKSYNKGLIMF